MDIPLEFWNKLSEQILVISSLLGGFSISVIASMVVADWNTRLSNAILAFATVAACCFLVCVFAMTSVHLHTIEGYPFQIDESHFKTRRLIGATSFLLGIISLVAMLSLTGWVKSKKLGLLTTIIGITTFMFIAFIFS